MVYREKKNFTRIYGLQNSIFYIFSSFFFIPFFSLLNVYPVKLRISEKKLCEKERKKVLKIIQGQIYALAYQTTYSELMTLLNDELVNVYIDILPPSMDSPLDGY